MSGQYDVVEAEEATRKHVTSCPLLNKNSYDRLVEDSAVAACEKLKDEVFQTVGKSVVQKAFYIVGAAIFAAAVWLNSKHF